MWCECHGVPPRRRSAMNGPRPSMTVSSPMAMSVSEDRRVRDRERDPADLRDRDPAHVGHAGLPALRRRAGGAQPLEQQPDAHHDVARDDHHVVDVLALVDRLEQRRQAEREDHDADHLHHRRQAVEPVVDVERGREPREVDPRPRDREGGDREAEQGRLDVPFGQVVRELVGREPVRDHEHQVEQQLQRRGDAVLLVRIAPAHARPAMDERVRHRDSVGRLPDNVSIASATWMRSIARSPRSTRIRCALKSTSACVAPCGGSKR